MTAPLITIDSSQLKKLQAQIRRLNPAKRTRVLRESLTQSAFVVQANAQNQIKRGGSAAPLPNRLTSRTGTGRRSITVERAALPFAIDIGTNLRYMALHETGGTVTIPSHRRTSSTGTTHRVRSHTARFPQRAFLVPGYNKSVPAIERIWFRNLKRMIETA